MLRLGGLEADEGGLDAGMAGKFGGADAQDFAGVQRLGDGAGDAHDDFQFAGAVGDALFQGAVEGLELTGHGFELGGELLDFVAGSGGGRNRTEVAGGDASGGQGQVTQATGGADGGEADEGGGQQGRAEQGIRTRRPGPLKASMRAVQGRSTTSRQPDAPRGAKPVMRWVPTAGPRRRAPEGD